MMDRGQAGRRSYVGRGWGQGTGGGQARRLSYVGRGWGQGGTVHRHHNCRFILNWGNVF
ncbi:MAG: hypothetical protein KME26_14195 [Oscillatoria princeps RMCB-10]|nr:hypothetical protein [Oscillatoria princeps RMCB-10]